MAVRRIQLKRPTNSHAVGGSLQLGQLKRVAYKDFTVLTTGSAADLTGYIDLAQGDLASTIDKAIITGIKVLGITVPATIALTQIAIYPGAAAAGTAVVAAAALTGMTAAGIVLDRTVVITPVVTTGRLYVRQTVDSGSTGVIRVIVEYIDATTLA